MLYQVHIVGCVLCVSLVTNCDASAMIPFCIEKKKTRLSQFVLQKVMMTEKVVREVFLCGNKPCGMEEQVLSLLILLKKYVSLKKKKKKRKKNPMSDNVKMST
jgi:hypothetical protein